MSTSIAINVSALKTRCAGIPEKIDFMFIRDEVASERELMKIIPRARAPVTHRVTLGFANSSGKSQM